MIWTGISPEQGPKISVPFRFYFLAYINILILLIFIFFKLLVENNTFINIDDILNLLETHHWIIFFHGISIGYILFIIFGSLFQMLPVVMGVIIPSSNYISIVLISLLYIIYFLLYNYIIKFNVNNFIIFLLLFFLFLILIIFFLIPLIKKTTISNIGFLLSLLSFVAGIFLLVLFFLNLNFHFFDLSLLEIRRRHATFMFIGFIQQLIVSVFFQILPMFYVTHKYPKYIQIILNSGYFILSIFFKDTYFSILIFFILNILFIIFSLWLILKRQRKIFDISLLFFYYGLICLFLGSFVSILFFFNIKFWMISLFLYILFIISIITGMLYKIIPFLCWFHLYSLRNQLVFHNITNRQKDIFSISFYMSDFIIRSVYKIQFAIFISIFLVFIWFLITMVDIKMLILLFILFFVCFFIQILYAIFTYIKIYNKII